MNTLRLLTALAAFALVAPVVATAGSPGATTGDANALTAAGASLDGLGNPNMETTFPPPGKNAVSITPQPSTITFGSTARIVGQVTGPGAVGMQVQLQENPHPYTGGFKDVGAPINTDGGGKYNFPAQPSRHTRYQVVAKAKPPVTSPVAQVLVRSRVSFTVSDSRIRRGQRVVFKGSVAPAHVGSSVSIQRRTSTGSYKTIARATLGAASGGRSVYSTRLRVLSAGTYRVLHAADADHARGTSARRSIRLGG